MRRVTTKSRGLSRPGVSASACTTARTLSVPSDCASSTRRGSISAPPGASRLWGGTTPRKAPAPRRPPPAPARVDLGAPGGVEAREVHDAPDGFRPGQPCAQVVAGFRGRDPDDALAPPVELGAAGIADPRRLREAAPPAGVAVPGG